jgi:DNA-binding MarR family transcriptional regulator
MENTVDTHEIRKFRRSLRQFQRLAGVQYRSCCGVTLAQCLVLLDIDEHGHLTMSQLALNLKLDQSTLSRTVDGLVNKKLVARLRDESDRRLVWIRLTENGAATCQEIHQGNDEYCRRVLENIPPSEHDEVIRNFEALIQAYLDHEASIEAAGTQGTGIECKE